MSLRVHRTRSSSNNTKTGPSLEFYYPISEFWKSWNMFNSKQLKLQILPSCRISNHSKCLRRLTTISSPAVSSFLPGLQLWYTFSSAARQGKPQLTLYRYTLSYMIRCNTFELSGIRFQIWFWDPSYMFRLSTPQLQFTSSYFDHTQQSFHISQPCLLVRFTRIEH